MFIIDNVASIRFGFFLGIFLSMALWEMIAPRRPLTQSKLTRWANNLALTSFNTLLANLVFPAAAVGTALYAEEKGW